MNSLRRLMLSAALAILTPAGAMADEVTVFAAASMKTALDAFASNWQAKTWHRVTISYAGSNLLAKQILQGAPADIFISAAENWMDEVEKAGLVAPGSRKDLLGNSLVLIAHGKDAAPVDISPALDLTGLLDGHYLAMGMVESVPAGQYGKAALIKLGLWEQIAPNVAQMDNVRAALTLVSSGEAPYGIVYATDAAADDEVTIVGTFPAETHPPILYPIALLLGAADEADKDFFAALSGVEAAKLFAAEGFSVLTAAK